MKTPHPIIALLALLPLLCACGGGGGGSNDADGLRIVQDHETLPPRFTNPVIARGGDAGADYAATWTAKHSGIIERVELYISRFQDADEPVVMAELWETDGTGKPDTGDPTKQLAVFEVRVQLLAPNFFYIPFDLRDRNIPIRSGSTYAVVLKRGGGPKPDVLWFGEGEVDTASGATWRRQVGDWVIQQQEDLAMRVLLEIGG